MAEYKNFAAQYDKFISSEERVSKAGILPLDVFRINTYRYKNEENNSSLRTREDATLLLVTGWYGKQVHGIKISYIKPQRFFEWTKTFILAQRKVKDVLKINVPRFEAKVITKINEETGLPETETKMVRLSDEEYVTKTNLRNGYPISEIFKTDDISGKQFYNQHIKNSSQLKVPKIPFRTYDREGIVQATRILFDTETLKKYYA
jgi:hypothetical protein